MLRKIKKPTKNKNKQHVYYTIFIFSSLGLELFFGDNLRITMRIITKTEIIITVDSRFRANARTVKNF